MNLLVVAARVAASWDNRIGRRDVARINREIVLAGGGPDGAAKVLARHGLKVLGPTPRFDAEREVSYGRGLPVGDAVLRFENDTALGTVCTLVPRDVPASVASLEARVLGVPPEQDSDD